jgi:hypothetical protein
MRLNWQVAHMIAVVVAAIPLSVIAAERRLDEPARNPATTPTPVAAAGVVRLPASIAGGVTSARQASQEDLAILAIRDDARKRVEEIQTRIAASPEGPARQPLMREVLRIKHEAELRVLETKLSFATVRGDRRAAQQIEEARARLLHPELVKAAPAGSVASSAAATRPVPSAPGKGGSR